MKILDVQSLRYHADVIHWDAYKPGTFREQFSIRTSTETSFWLGVALNGVKTDWERCRLEFNPNKVKDHPMLVALLNFFLQNTSPSQRKVKRFDLAIDIPVQRQDCILVKDRRLYIERRHGKEHTQYLGAKSSTVGRVKLYNKQIESDLPDPLTRLELTLDPDTSFEKIPFPEVHCLDRSLIEQAGKRVTETDRFILNALLQGYGSVNDLGRKTRAKMERLLSTCAKPVEVEPENYEVILRQLQDYISRGVRREPMKSESSEENVDH